MMRLDLPDRLQSLVKRSERSQPVRAFEGATNVPADFVRRRTRDFAKQSSLQNAFVICDRSGFCDKFGFRDRF
jgi:hypothetical protein